MRKFQRQAIKKKKVERTPYGYYIEHRAPVQSDETKNVE